jgi:hypothetical protein
MGWVGLCCQELWIWEGVLMIIVTRDGGNGGAGEALWRAGKWSPIVAP